MFFLCEFRPIADLPITLFADVEGLIETLTSVSLCSFTRFVFIDDFSLETEFGEINSPDTVAVADCCFLYLPRSILQQK